ncbi:unnamed protein product [Scytosiphon promiscuus]
MWVPTRGAMGNVFRRRLLVAVASAHRQPSRRLLSRPAAASAAAATAAAAPPQRSPTLPFRLQSSSLSMSAIPAGQQPTSAISTLNRDPRVASTLVLQDTRQVEVFWDDGHNSHHDYTWLRVNCPSFVHKSGQRTVFPGDVDPELTPVEVSASDSVVKVAWSDGHESEYKTDWLRAHDNSPSALHERSHGSWPTPLCAWDAIPKVDSNAYMEDDEALYRTLRKINRSGVALLENVGVRERSVVDLARRVAPVSHQTLYGEVFDVVSQEKPRNLAYTSERLRLHMDLVYYESPPGLQFLHCLEFDEEVKGGATIFMDAFAAAEHFRDSFPEKFEVLSRVPATFEKIRAAAPGANGEDRNTEALKACHMEYQRPIFQVDANGDILAVNWAPMFEGVLMCATRDMAPYYAAYREFQHLIEEGQYADKHTIKKRLEPGQCLVFNNRRMLHGREVGSRANSTMTPSGKNIRRRLQGCYVNIDDATSRLCSLHTARPPPSSSSFSSPFSDHEDDNHDGTSAPEYITRAGNGSLPLVS